LIILKTTKFINTYFIQTLYKMEALEICVFSPESCLNAQVGGAQRIELCGGLYEGGTTPSIGLITWAVENLSIETHVMVRPRGGDFCYDDLEFVVMCRDIEMIKNIGAAGVVLGILNPDGTVNIARTKQLVELAKPLKTTFHRAFDRTNEPFKALEDVIETGAIRILTSGQKPTAIDGKALIGQLVIAAAGRIEIMAGAGVSADNAAELLATGVDALHLTAKSTRPSLVQYQNPDLKMASVINANEFEIVYSDVDKTRKLSSICGQSAHVKAT
jgi:copper homeostasis protein